MSEASELLATLRDVVEPPPPAGVPPALVLANIALVALLVAFLLHRRRRRRRAWLDAALARIHAARVLPQDAALLELAALLRRVMRHRHGTRVDALQGDAWLARLDETFGDDWFGRGEGRVFGDALYAPRTARDVDIDRLTREIARRLKRLRPVPRGEAVDVPPSPVGSGSR